MEKLLYVPSCQVCLYSKWFSLMMCHLYGDGFVLSLVKCYEEFFLLACEVTSGHKHLCVPCPAGSFVIVAET